MDPINNLLVELLRYRSFRDLAGFKNRPKWQKLSFFLMFWRFFREICFGNLIFANIWYIFDVRSTFEKTQIDSINTWTWKMAPKWPKNGQKWPKMTKKAQFIKKKVISSSAIHQNNWSWFIIQSHSRIYSIQIIRGLCRV